MHSRLLPKLITLLFLFFGAAMSAQADISISATTDAAEPATNGAFTVTRTGDTSLALTVLFNTPTGTATGGADYVTPASVVIPANAASATVTVTVGDDSLVEGIETVILTITPDAAYVIGTASATVDITDNDSLSLSIVHESDGSEDGSFGSFLVTHTGIPTVDVTVLLAVPTGTAISGIDYNPYPSSFIIPAGQPENTLNILNIQIIDDAIVESTETVIFTIIADAAYGITTGSASFDIVDNDAAPTPDVSIIQNSDANESGTAGQFAISRTGSTANPLTVQLAGPTGTATSGADYTALPTSVTLPAGTGNFVLNVPPVDDALVEGTETVILTIAADAAYNITTGSATLNIIDNDGAIVDISIAQTSHANESGTDGVFTLSRTGSTANALTIQLATPTGTATSGTDYNTQPTSLTIAAGQATGVLNITPIDDALVEGTETVILAIAAAAAYNITTGSATVNIVDNDLNSGSNTPIPTLTTWALILMILSLIFIAIPIMTRQR